MKNIIGILGGMGPEASCHIYKKILEYCQKKYGAVQDEDYPRIVLNSLSLKGFSETGVVSEQLVTSQLVQGVQMLQNAFCDHIIIACNTVNIYHEQMQASVYTPIINVVVETTKMVKKGKHKKVGLLSSETTRDLGLYQDELEKNGIECITADDDQQAIITQVIKRVMGGIQDKSDICELGEIIENQKKKGITAVVLGCTELPLAITQDDISLPEYNANDVLVHTVVDKMYKIDG